MRVNAYIPDGLAQKIEPHRQSLNISQILQRALVREVARLEASAARGADLNEEAVKRLLVEKQEFEQDWENEGLKLGMQWALDAAYADLVSIRDEICGRWSGSETELGRLQRSMWIDWDTVSRGTFHLEPIEAAEAEARGFARGVALVAERLATAAEEAAEQGTDTE